MKTKILKRYPKPIAVYTGAALLSLLVPWLFGYLIDNIILKGNFQSFGAWIIVSISIALLSSLTSFYFLKYLPTRLGIENSIALQNQALHDILRMTSPSYEQQEKGYYYNAVMNSTGQYGDLHEELHLRFVANGLVVLVILGIAFLTHPVFSFLFLLYALLLVLFSLAGSKPLFEMQKDAMIRQDGWLNLSKAMIESKREINAMDADHFYMERFRKTAREWLNYICRYRFFQILVDNIPSCWTVSSVSPFSQSVYFSSGREA